MPLVFSLPAFILKFPLGFECSWSIYKFWPASILLNVFFFLLILGSSSTRIIRFWSRNIFNDIRQLRNQINHLWSWQNYQSVQRRWNSNGRKPPYQLETGYSKTQEILIYLQVLKTLFFKKYWIQELNSCIFSNYHCCQTVNFTFSFF